MLGCFENEQQHLPLSDLETIIGVVCGLWVAKLQSSLRRVEIVSDQLVEGFAVCARGLTRLAVMDTRQLNRVCCAHCSFLGVPDIVCVALPVAKAMVVSELLTWSVPPKLVVVVLLLLWNSKVVTTQDLPC